MEKISWIYRVRKKYYISVIKAERNILHTLKRRICHDLRRNCLQKLVEGTVEGSTEEVMG